MMNEASLTAKLKERTMALLPPPRLFTKLHDGSTAGIPDVAVDWNLETWWVEAKFVRLKSTVAREVMKHPLQMATMILKQMATGKALYLVYQQHGAKAFSTTLWRPIDLNHALKSGLADPTPGCTTAVDGLLYDAFADRSPYQAACIFGGCSVAGLDHGLLAGYLKDRGSL